MPERDFFGPIDEAFQKAVEIADKVEEKVKEVTEKVWDFIDHKPGK